MDRDRKTRSYGVVSLFSGCGGLDLGFQGDFESLGKNYEKLPFEIAWAGDLNPHAVETYRQNLSQEAVCGDIWDCLSELPRDPDVLIGGFPCQDISVNGKGRGVEKDTRSGLYRAMVAAIKATKPRVFVAENVKGLLMRHNKEALATVLADFSGLGYEVSYELYQAADYGVAQTRERVFIVGTARGLPSFEPPVGPLSEEDWISAREAIGDLESLPEDPEWSHIWSRAGKSAEQGNRRLKAERPGYTIRAEHHGNIQFHYSLPRRISMREAARIQSFPDDFAFASRLRETERQIGNAVPPVLGWHVARAVRAVLDLAPATGKGTDAQTESSPEPTRPPSLAIA